MGKIEILEGLLEATSGDVEVLGYHWGRHDDEIRQRIGISLQETKLAEKLSVRETLNLFRSFYANGIAPEVAMSEVSLEEKSGTWVGKLSGGQKQRAMIAMAMACKPDLLIASNDYFTMYEQSQVAIKRYTSSDEADGGFISLKYKNADVFFDSSGGIPAAHAYFINTDYLELVVHSQANWTMMDELRSVNQDAIVIPILWMGNVVCSNRSLQGVQKA